MSIAFSNSMRSLYADRERPSLIGLGVALLFLLLWLIWFFFAQLTIHESGQIVQTANDGQILADFPIGLYDQVQRGQLAFIRPQGEAAERISPLPATVLTVQMLPELNKIRVELYAETIDIPTLIALEEGINGEVEIEIDHISPAALVLQASGQFLDTPSVSLSPQ